MKFSIFHHSRRQKHAVYQTRSSAILRVAKLSTILFLMMVLHTLAMVQLENLSLLDASWLTLTTITTVGYGDISATSTAGRITTILLMYLVGITVLAQLISEYVDYRMIRNEYRRKGNWRWNMENHILIINAPNHNAEQYFIRLVSQIREHTDYRDTPIQLLTPKYPDVLPIPLRNLGVVHFTGTADNMQDLQSVNVKQAKHIVVLARDEYSKASDSTTFDELDRLKEFGVLDRTIVECVVDENRERFHRIGAPLIIRPARSYPEIIVRSLMAPGSEKILEDLFTHTGGQLRRYEINIDNKRWADIVTQLIQAGMGSALAYVSPNNDVICHPNEFDAITAKALLVMVRDNNIPSTQSIEGILE